jgi:two-component system CheB/CheR fusion protein
MEVLQFRGATGEFLEPPVGKATFNLLKMAREGLMLPLRSALQKARKENKAVTVPGVRFGERGRGRPRRVNLQVTPLKNLKDCCYLVLFEPADGARPAALAAPHAEPSPGAGKRSPTGEKQTSRRVAELEREL